MEPTDQGQRRKGKQPCGGAVRPLRGHEDTDVNAFRGLHPRLLLWPPLRGTEFLPTPARSSCVTVDRLRGTETQHHVNPNSTFVLHQNQDPDPTTQHSLIKEYENSCTFLKSLARTWRLELAGHLVVEGKYHLLLRSSAV